LPLHGLDKLQDHILLPFLDTFPAEHQEHWFDLVAPYDKPVSELLITQEQGKQLWSKLLKKRDPVLEVIVAVDNDDRRAKSIIYAIADTLNIPRDTIYDVGDPDNKHADPPPNPHTYDVIKTSRMMVI
jgi:hypothetical protein